MQLSDLKLHSVIQFVREVLNAYWVLIRIMVPALIVVKILEEAGGIDFLAQVLSPLMETVGLESELGIVWATAMLTNLYTAIAVFYQLAADQPMNVAQISTLGAMILISHALPIEGAVAKAVGIPWFITLIFRVGGAYLLGLLCHLSYELTGSGLEIANLVWKPEPTSDSLLGWVYDQGKMLASVFVILGALMAMIRGLQYIGINKYLNLALNPLMKILTVKKDAADITIIGLLLGLSFGAGLLINESAKGRISKRDMTVVVCFLGLCHSVIEDTLLILLLGADLNAILWGRVLFSCVLIFIVARTLFRESSNPTIKINSGK